MGLPWKEIWNGSSICKVFYVDNLLGKILTLDVLNRKGMYLPNIFISCYGDGESVAHTLIHCPFVVEVWRAMIQDFGLS